MNIFEGYKKAVEIYNKNSGTEDGRKTVTWYNNKLGVSKEYLVWFTTCVICYGIPLYAVLHTYRDWKRYVVSYYKKTSQPIPNIESLNYQQTMKIINECKRHWAKPNPIYNQNGVYVGEFKSFCDANMLPINTNWCITKTKSRYNEFNNENSKCLYIINNSNQDPWRRVIAVVYTDRVEYWDSTNIRIDDNAPYEKTLPIEAVNIIHSRYKNNTNENKQHKTRYNMKKTIRLSESDLHRMIKESVKRVLREGEYDSIGVPTPHPSGDTFRKAQKLLYPYNDLIQTVKQAIEASSIEEYQNRCKELLNDLRIGYDAVSKLCSSPGYENGKDYPSF